MNETGVMMSKPKMVKATALRGSGVRRFLVSLPHPTASGGVIQFPGQAHWWPDGRLALGLPVGPDGIVAANLARVVPMHSWPVYAVSKADAEAVYKKLMGIINTLHPFEVQEEGPAPDEIPLEVLQAPYFHPDAWSVDSPMAAEERRRRAAADAARDRKARKGETVIYDRLEEAVASTEQATEQPAAAVSPSDLYASPDGATPEPARGRKRS